MKGQCQQVWSTSKISGTDNAKSKHCETEDQPEQENSLLPGHKQQEVFIMAHQAQELMYRPERMSPMCLQQRQPIPNDFI